MVVVVSNQLALLVLVLLMLGLFVVLVMVLAPPLGCCSCRSSALFVGQDPQPGTTTTSSRVLTWSSATGCIALANCSSRTPSSRLDEG